MIPYGRQDINQADVDSVIDVLKSDFLTQGPQVPLFEESVAITVGQAPQWPLTVQRLHYTQQYGSRSGEGDWLWTSPNSFVASANCGLYCGANVDFVDIDPQTYNCVPTRSKRS